MPKHAGLCPDPYRRPRIGWTTLLKGGENEALMAKATTAWPGYPAGPGTAGASWVPAPLRQPGTGRPRITLRGAGAGGCEDDPRDRRVPKSARNECSPALSTGPAGAGPARARSRRWRRWRPPRPATPCWPPWLGVPFDPVAGVDYIEIAETVTALATDFGALTSRPPGRRTGDRAAGGSAGRPRQTAWITSNRPPPPPAGAAQGRAAAAGTGTRSSSMCTRPGAPRPHARARSGPSAGTPPRWPGRAAILAGSGSAVSGPPGTWPVPAARPVRGPPHCARR
jgi:hypothetical protein